LQSRFAIIARIRRRDFHLTHLEQKENIGTEDDTKTVTSRGIIAMSVSPFDDCHLDNSHYEQACDQAIAMCDGNLRSTIKALIMANEYLETELTELQAAISSGCVPKKLSGPACTAA
jgi:hypothetical protein